MLSRLTGSDKTMFLGAGAMLLVLLALATLSLARLSALEANSNTNSRTYAVMMAARDLLRDANELETIADDLLVSDRYKEAYERYKARFSLDFNRVFSLIKDFPDPHYVQQRERHATLKKQYKSWFGVFNPAVALRRQNGGVLPPRARAAVPLMRSKMAIVRNTIYEIQNVENQLLNVRSQERVALQNTARTTFLGAILLAMGCIAVLSMGLLQGGRKLQLSHADLRTQSEQRRRAEREAQVLYRHNEQILNSTTEGIIGLNLKGRITFVNPAAAHTTGWDITELIGKSLHDFIHHTKTDGTRYAKEASPILASLQDGRVRRVIDEVFWRREGHPFPVEYTVTPLWESTEDLDSETAPRAGENQDSLVGAAVTFRDITERKRAEIALLRLASIVESSKDAILSHMLDGSIVSCNASAVRMYGYSARELEGQPLDTLFPRSRPEEIAFLKETIAHGGIVEPYQTTMMKKDGTPLDVAVTFYPVKDASGHIMGASSNARPIRRQAGVTINLPTFSSLQNGSASNTNGNGSSGNGAAAAAASESASRETANS
ncbi:MAG: hypothetical protein JWN98_1614 [Abditibacteriota bacterium]|nr:hypothetical protein [Abditibacteriota bacterium]